MSTRSTTHFHGGAPAQDAAPEAIVYRHPDGYPESMLPALEMFFTDVEAQTRDTRYGDPSYLAAKWCVWLADYFRQSIGFDRDKGEYVRAGKKNLLDFISVGIVMEDPGDIEYRYHVWCGATDHNGRPLVTYEEVPF